MMACKALPGMVLLTTGAPSGTSCTLGRKETCQPAAAERNRPPDAEVFELLNDKIAKWQFWPIYKKGDNLVLDS